MTWQPIETAPKDGTRVLLLVPSLSRNRIQIGTYYDTETLRYGKSAGRLQRWGAEGVSVFYDGSIEPLYWQPLPSDDSTQ